MLDYEIVESVYFILMLRIFGALGCTSSGGVLRTYFRGNLQFAASSQIIRKGRKPAIDLSQSKVRGREPGEHMVRSTWLKAQKHLRVHSKDMGPRRSLENRIVLCADCDSNRTLAISASGNLVCSSCSSQNWMFASTSIITRFNRGESCEPVHHLLVY
jgi:hypothetical protein